MIQRPRELPEPALAVHSRTIGWVSTTALALGGSNQSLFLIGALFVGQGSIPGQGSAAVPLLIVGLLLSSSLALKTTAEGVETREQLDRLRTMGCTNAQGYFFARPLTTADANAFIENWSPEAVRVSPAAASGA